MGLYKFYLGTHTSGKKEKMPPTTLFYPPPLSCLKLITMIHSSYEVALMTLQISYNSVIEKICFTYKNRGNDIELKTVKITIFLTLTWIIWRETYEGQQQYFNLFSTSDNVFRVLWLVHSILVISSYTLVSPYMVNIKCFRRKAKFFSEKSQKRKKKAFLWKVWINADVYRSRRKDKKSFLWWAHVCLTTRCYTESHLHQFFFRIRSDFFAFFARMSYFKFLEFKEFNNTIIPFALVGYETGYSQLGATRLVGYLPFHIQRAHEIIAK